MSSALEYGRRILMKRMIQTLEQEGYRVEFAEDYNGWIVAGQGEDPAVMLLEADAIERIRSESPGNARGFLDGITSHVRSQISAEGSASLHPPETPDALEYADVPSGPPVPVTGEVADDMIVGEESFEQGSEPPPAPPAEDVPVEDVPIDEEYPLQDAGTAAAEEPVDAAAASAADAEAEPALMEGAEPEEMEPAGDSMVEEQAAEQEQEPEQVAGVETAAETSGEEPAAEEPAGQEQEEEQKERMESEVTEELSFEDVK